MRLIDADRAVKDFRRKLEEKVSELDKLKSMKAVTREDRASKSAKINDLEVRIATGAEFIAFLVYDCPEVKIDTKEKEQTQ